jgi:AmmeMemoRadiSam system protein A
VTSESQHLSTAEREFLVLVAEKAVEAAAQGLPAPDPRKMAQEMAIDLEPRLAEKRGVFVTLTSEGRLRGCIGYIEGFKPLVDAVAENGRSAAISDPRFPPVSIDEVPQLEIEVSALTPLVEVAGPE